MRTGVRLGIDVGKVRIGVSRSDPHGMIATPMETPARMFSMSPRYLSIMGRCFSARSRGLPKM